MTITILVVDMGVPVRECATFDILATDSHVISLINKRGESKSFGCSPVNASARVNRFVTRPEYLCDLWMEVPLSRQNCDHVTYFTESVKVNTSVSDITIQFRVLDCIPSYILPVLSIKLEVLAFCVGFIEIGLSLLFDLS